MRRWMFVLLLAALAACAGLEPVHLWNPKTDQIVACGPFGEAERAPERERAMLAACIARYEKQGFVHGPMP